MIARALRLRQPFEFERVRKRGRSWSTRLLVLSVLANDLEHNRYGFAVGRRVGGAVRRNRVKRWLREAVRCLHPALAQGYDLVFIARGPLADESVSYQQVAGAVDSLCRRAGLLAASPPDCCLEAAP
ncbi:MAG TPA: ribonuclease P protein component [Thermomicrobiaceae bacterium]|nr:ribonuclease P protein component [Thermomicrobiaceae bacterium]